MHRDQVHIDTDIARALIFEQFPAYRGQPIERIGAIGTVNGIFRIGADAAARFPLRATRKLACAALLRSEAASMAAFARHCPVATPRPIGIDGDAATPGGLAASADFARDVAGLTTALRAAGTQGRRFDGQGRGGNLRDHDRWMETCFGNSRPDSRPTFSCAARASPG
jgi:aminoglycoside phosphotransferase (APT) family kinase protein